MRNHLLTAGALVIALAGFARRRRCRIATHPARHGLRRSGRAGRRGSRADAGDLAYWYSDNSRAALGPDDGPESFWRRPYAPADDEVNELQRMFPSSPWPQSMRD